MTPPLIVFIGCIIILIVVILKNYLKQKQYDYILNDESTKVKGQWEK